MNRTAEYCAQAEHCRQMADKVISPVEKEAWLQLAANWLALGLIHQRSASRFDEMQRNHSTDQTKSEGEH